MTEKRFTLAYSNNLENDKWWAVRDGDITLWKEEVVELLNELHEENQLLKQRLAEQNDVKWLRNNTVWQVMPSSHRTYTSTTYHRRNDE